MIKIRKSKDFDENAIPVDPFWNTGEEKELKMHRIHAYPAKFPSFITTKALQYAKEKGVDLKRIADIFCGCGTVAYEAKRNGIPFWGCDINPVATMIAKAKGQSYNTWRLLDYFDKIVYTYKTVHMQIAPYSTTHERIKYWFDLYNYRNLAKLRNAIDYVIPANSKYHTFFLVALSNILKPTSRWLTKSIKPQLDPNKIAKNVLTAFQDQCEFSILASEESDAKDITKIHIETSDFLSPRLRKPKVNMIITSPPYVTSYEYADLHQLSFIWFGNDKDYKILKAGSIGSHHRYSEIEKDINRLNNCGKETVNRLAIVNKSKARAVAKYFLDIQATANAAYAMLDSNGIILFVIGNTKYSGVTINNAGHLIESIFAAGFKGVNISKRKISKKILTPYRDQKGRFTSNANGRKVYSEEFIIIGHK